MTDDRAAGAAAPNPEAMSNELLGSLETIRHVISSVTRGESLQQLAVGYPETHPVGALTASINAMLESLEDSRRHTQEYMRELQDKIETIERQRAAIQDLSTPIIEVWPGVLCAPIIGVLDGVRATEMTRTLLGAVVERKTPLVIIDITGIEDMDTRASDNFVRMVRSVRLLGARCVLSGVHPNIARTVIQLGVDLSGIESYRSLRDVLRKFVRMTPKTTTAKAPTGTNQ